MFPKLKTKLENSEKFIDGYQSLIGKELLEHFEELRSSKIFRDCEIYGVDLRDSKPSGELRYIPKSKWSRLRGKIYIYSISLDTSPDPECLEYVIFGYLNECKFSHDRETALRLDRLYELSKLDI